jgi:hypothetical protein
LGAPRRSTFCLVACRPHQTRHPALGPRTARRGRRRAEPLARRGLAEHTDPQGFIKRLARLVNHPHRFPFHFVRHGLEARRPREERQECGGVDHPTLRLSHSLVHRDPAGRCYVDSHVDTQDLGGPPRVARLQDLQALGKSTHFSLCVFWWSWMCSTPSLFRFVASSRSRVAFSTSFVISTVYGHVHTLLHRARRVIRSAFIPEHPAIRSPTITVSAAPDGPRRGGTAGDHRRPHADRCSPGITLGIPHQP